MLVFNPFPSASMGFFATFWSWLNGQLAAYIGDNTSRLAAVLEPAVVTVATIYVMAWGYLHITGKIAEPLEDGVKRVALIALILGVGLRLWLYNTVIVDTFYSAPAQLAAAMVGASDPVGTIDAIWNSGGTVAGNLWDKGGLLSGDFGFYLAGAVVAVLDRRALRICDVPDCTVEHRPRGALWRSGHCSLRCCFSTPRDGSSAHGSGSSPTMD